MEENRRRATSIRQLELMINYMEQHRDLALGRVRSKEGRALAGRLWEECASILNAEGTTRNPKEWSRFWNDYKCRVRGKLSQRNREHTSTGGGPSAHIHFSPLEDRVASLIGRDAGPLSGVRRDPIIDVVEEGNNIQEGHTNIEIESTISPTILEIHYNNNLSPQHERSINEEDQGNEGNLLEQVQPSIEREQSEGRRSVRSRVRSRQTYRNNNAELSSARASIARIEEMRARTEELMAAANLKQSEAALKHADAAAKQAEALLSIAQSLQIIAQCGQSYLASLVSRNQ